MIEFLFFVSCASIVANMAQWRSGRIARSQLRLAIIARDQRRRYREGDVPNKGPSRGPYRSPGEVQQRMTVDDIPGMTRVDEPELADHPSIHVTIRSTADPEPEHDPIPTLLAVYKEQLALSQGAHETFHDTKGAIANMWYDRYQTASRKAVETAKELFELGHDVLTEDEKDGG